MRVLLFFALFFINGALYIGLGQHPALAVSFAFSAVLAFWLAVTRPDLPTVDR
jgi:hypothetical protein